MSQLFEHLFDILGSERFLNMEGLANEVPIFIQTYQVKDEDRMSASIKALASRLRNSGIPVAEVDLFQLLIDELSDEDILDDLIADEPTFDRSDLYATLRNHADPPPASCPDWSGSWSVRRRD